MGVAIKIAILRVRLKAGEIQLDGIWSACTIFTEVELEASLKVWYTSLNEQCPKSLQNKRYHTTKDSFFEGNSVF